MRLRRPLPPVLALLAAATAAALTGCGDEGPHPMLPGRHRERPDRDVPPGKGSRERLGLPELPPRAGRRPAGWTPLPPGRMRLLSFRITGEVPGDLSVSRAGGSVDDNVNRWRGQLGLEALDAAAVAALPRQPLLGVPAVRVSAQGTYTGMQGEPQPGFAILGLVSERGPERLFVKLVGPAALVAAQEQAFDEFVAGLVPASEGSPAPEPEPEPEPRDTLDPARLRYDLPPGWSVVPTTKPFRLADFRIEGAAGVEGVLSHLTGDGGGLANNLNRWRGQMGQEELSEAAIASLERVPMLGRQAVLIEIPGRYRGMGGEDVADALYLGVVCLLEQDALFLRLVGPKPAVEGQRAALRALLASFRVQD